MPPNPEPDDDSVADRAAESEAVVAAKPPVSKPAVRQPAVRKPDVRKPAARKPAVRSTTAPTSAATKATTVTPAAATPTTEAGNAKSAAEGGDTKPAGRKPAARKSSVRKPTAARIPSVPAPSVTPKSKARTTAQTLADNASDETTRPYSTRDALVTTAMNERIAPSLDPIDKPTSQARTVPAAAAGPVTQPAANAAQDVPSPVALAPVVIEARGLVKRFGHNVAVSNLDLTVRAGSFYGIVGPNGAGKTTTLSMITGLLRPTAGTALVHGIDVWVRPNEAKRVIGVLPDRLRLFDRLTGAQLLYYAGTLRGLDNDTVRSRSADLAAAFGLEDALNRLVVDYSAGMTKKIALACAMIHSPRVLVLDEPLESVDPVSAVNVTEILQKYVAAGGTVVLSSHGMDLIQRVCDHVAIIVQGRVLAAGTIDDVRGQKTLEDRFVELAGGRKVAEGMEWLHNFSD